LNYRSVHNIRIERLWVDFTAGVGAKWKAFFEELEIQVGLDSDLPSHIWLVHYLFLGALNQDIVDWANAWNNHKMRIPGHGTCSPAELRWFSMLESGAQGFVPGQAADFDPVEDNLMDDEIAEYGIDWDGYWDNHILNHHSGNNPPDPFSQNPFVSHQPDNLNTVQVDESRCPFSPDELDRFVYNLSLLPEAIRLSRDMSQRKQLWILALSICRQIMA